MANLNLKINEAKCVKCGACVEACGVRIIQMNKGEFPKSNSDREAFCLKCQHCLAACPTGALSVFSQNPENAAPVKDYVSPQDMLGLIQTRRSCRHYKRENLPADTIAKLKDMLAWVPTGCNAHNLHFSVVEDIDVMDKIIEKTLKKLRLYLRFIPVSGVLNAFKKPLMKGMDLIFNGAPHMIVVSVPKNTPCKDVDPYIALSYFELYANSMGLGTLWCGLAYICFKLFPSVRKQLGIPKGYEMKYVMLFGAPDDKFYRGTLPEPCSFSVVKEVK